MKKLLYAALAALAVSCAGTKQHTEAPAFMRVEGQNIIAPDGSEFFIRGTNLGNWLNPEGYMFGFTNTNSAGFINQMLCQLVGPDRTAQFWQDFKDNYITRADIDFIASTGANTIRLPFHYKLFTDEDYMGGTSNDGEGFRRIDSVVTWCRDAGMYLILDMHDAPGGQTGDNIDDSHGYPWLFVSEPSAKLFCDIWKEIAARYADEPVILGYELINEPIAPYFDEVPQLNAMLEPLHKRAVDSIRTVDKNHIILLGAPQWNSNFEPFEDTSYDDNIMYTCHRYGGDATAEAIGSFIAFRDKSNLPMYMGEIGHNTDQWQDDFTTVLEQSNIGYTFWPYKKIDGSCMAAITPPAQWDSVKAFAEAPRHSYKAIREARPAAEVAQKALDDFITASRLENCTPQKSYIKSIKLNID